jgi:hypothetical protein
LALANALPPIRPLSLPAERQLLRPGHAGTVYDLDFASGGADAAAITAAGLTFARSGAAYGMDGTSFADGVPRIVSGSGLLLEAAARTNLALRASDLSATWTKTNVTAATASTAAPDGTQAYIATETSATGNHEILQAISVTNGTVYTWSAHVKLVTGTRWVMLYGPATTYCHFNPATGAIGATAVATSYGSAALGNGWYRVWITMTAGSTGNVNHGVRFKATNNSASSYAGDTGQAVAIWGAQLEAGAYPSSPIPTVGSTVARAAESCLASRSVGLLTQGTVIVEATAAPGVSSVLQAIYGLYVDAATYLWIYRGATGAIGGGSDTAPDVAFGVVSNSASFKTAMAWSASGYRISHAGGTVSTGAVSSTAFDHEAFGDLPPYGRPSFCWIRRLRRYAHPLSDAELTMASS